MQRPSFALAVLFGALASGLVVANVAPCQVIVVFHEVQTTEDMVQIREQELPAELAQPEYAPADQPAVSAPPAVTIAPVSPSEASLANTASSDPAQPSDASRNETPSPVALAPVAEATPSVPWLETGATDPADAMPPVAEAPTASSELATDMATDTATDAATEVATPGAFESAQAASSEQAGGLERSELVENIAKNVAESVAADASAGGSASVPTVATTIPEDRSTNDLGDVAPPESTVETAPPMALEPLRDAARGAAVTLDATATWAQDVAGRLRTWADGELNGQTP